MNYQDTYKVLMKDFALVSSTVKSIPSFNEYLEGVINAWKGGESRLDCGISVKWAQARTAQSLFVEAYVHYIVDIGELLIELAGEEPEPAYDEPERVPDESRE